MATTPAAARPRSRSGFGGQGRARIGRLSRRAFLYLLSAIVVLIVAFPLFWMISTSFKSKTEMYVLPPSLFPLQWTLGNYADLFANTNFGDYYRNSLIVAIAATSLSLLVGSLAAYSLGRFRFRGLGVYSRIILIVYMLPSALLVIPLYILATQLHLQDTLFVLIITDSTFTLPFTIWLLRAYFATIPVDLEDAAMIDGCSRLAALFKVVLPIAVPGIIATSIFAFTSAWNEFLFALVFISTDELRTLPVGLLGWIGTGDSQMNLWNMLLAAAVLMTLPVLVFYGVVQRYLVVDLSAGGAKG